MRPRLLCISQSFPPETTPTAIRAGKLLERLAVDWEVTVLTEHAQPGPSTGVEVRAVPARHPRRLLAAIRRMRLGKLLELTLWPDESVFWLIPAIRAGRRALSEGGYEAIVVFMMPYSSGIAGLVLSRLSGLALILNLDDSPTCTDMHPAFPSRLHHRLARGLEDRYVRWADAVVYVSETNLERVAERQPPGARARLHLVRYGAEPGDFTPQPQPPERFEIVYVGAMSGWWSLIPRRVSGLPARVYEAWTRLGRFELLELDDSTSSPAAIGHAVQSLLTAHPGWAGRVAVTLYGNPYPDDVVGRALGSAGVCDVVSVHGPVPHERVAELMGRADLLFLALPDRPDGSRGGRISAKTYEYLMTDRPVLAALPAGENWDYLAGRPGVQVVGAGDEQAMATALAPLVEDKLAGRAQPVDRAGLRDALSYEARAAEFAEVIRAALARARSRRPPRRLRRGGVR